MHIEDDNCIQYAMGSSPKEHCLIIDDTGIPSDDIVLN